MCHLYIIQQFYERTKKYYVIIISLMYIGLFFFDLLIFWYASHSVFSPGMFQGMSAVYGWGMACGHIKDLGLLPFPHQRKICTQGLLGRHALSMLGRTLTLVSVPFAHKTKVCYFNFKMCAKSLCPVSAHYSVLNVSVLYLTLTFVLL